MSNAAPIQFSGLDNLLWGVVASVQFYTLPVMALAIATLGLLLIYSGDNTDRKSVLKGHIFNILVGGLLVFGATTIATVVKTFLTK